jgi:hypothetical protein
MTPREFAMSAAVAERVPIAIEITDAYEALRFGGQVDAAARLVELVGRLEKSGAEEN